MNHVLIWIVATFGPQGPVTQEIKDPTPTMAEKVCKEFGESHKTRMEDWVRGVLRAHWDHPVHVEYRCEADGKPA
jgi:hypothetical protein